VTDLQASISCVRGVTLDSVTRVYPSLAEVGMTESSPASQPSPAQASQAQASQASPLRLGNVASGDYTVFTFEFTVAGMARPVSRARIARLELSGSTPGLGRENVSTTEELFISFSADEAAVSNIDVEVLGYVQQRNVDRMVQDAVRQAATDAPGARQTLHAALGLTQRVGNPAVTRMIQDALDEFDKTGAISSGMRKTIALGGRTRTIKTSRADALEGLPSEEQIRKMTGA
jgi:Ca-activated chloride channel family protein